MNHVLSLPSLKERSLPFIKWLMLQSIPSSLSHSKGHFTHKTEAHDHGNLRALIGRKGEDRPSSLHTQRWKPKGPKKTSWMQSLHGVLRGGLWIRFHGLPRFSSGPPPIGGPDANSGRPWFLKDFFQHDIFQDRFRDRFYNKFQDRFQDRQTPPSSSLKLVEFEMNYIKPYPPLVFPPTKYDMVPQRSPFSLHTMIEGPWLHKTAFPIPIVWPLDESQGFSPLQGHNSWLMCEVALKVQLFTPKSPSTVLLKIGRNHYFWRRWFKIQYVGVF